MLTPARALPLRGACPFGRAVRWVVLGSRDMREESSELHACRMEVLSALVPTQLELRRRRASAAGCLCIGSGGGGYVRRESTNHLARKPHLVLLLVLALVGALATILGEHRHRLPQLVRHRLSVGEHCLLGVHPRRWIAVIPADEESVRQLGWPGGGGLGGGFGGLARLGGWLLGGTLDALLHACTEPKRSAGRRERVCVRVGSGACCR